ncbi:(2Fe-2S)-binding protein [Solirubrobacter sp. CPCC 204708]|uniref:(2Fe-2S)-binding protein n=1 Tax=Solirubrobacter deserti TaxID=2282478 RepID=A0ABT4RFG4_9ACTN|nr:(2Fe-2S)-binding protein [Solirubrobacter deserti]MBE2319480.1 (2Fe-2S)-binding protein [Solirubrobacter deserti]MDA0137233.1 (2Fe-2S)-binding protein [Solirubrobacter deserti]
MSATTITTRINGREQTLRVDNAELLLDLLRDRGLTGAKPSCEMEVCGACTVQLDGLPVSACTTLAVELDGRSVETVEHLDAGGELHPVQQAFLERSALQCGFCTPGMVMTAKALLESNPQPTRDEVTHWLEGSICRCTGYEPIVDAVLTAAQKMAA